MKESMKKKDSEAPMDDDIHFEPEDEVVIEKKKGDKLKQKKDELKACREERQEYLTGWQKARAELINYKKQQEKERERTIIFANERLISDLLPVVDSFEMARSNAEAWEAVPENWRIGVEYIQTQLQKVLENHGVTEIAATETFDPQFHEPVEIIDTEKKKEDNRIAKVVQKGYLIKEKVLRPAKVHVYKVLNEE